MRLRFVLRIIIAFWSIGFLLSRALAYDERATRKPLCTQYTEKSSQRLVGWSVGLVGGDDDDGQRHDWNEKSVKKRLLKKQFDLTCI